MAIEARARRIGVRIGQWEADGVVVESCRLPGNGSVASLASLREAPCDVVRIRGALEIFQVAGSAGRAGQVVVVVDMTIEAYAGRIGVRIREREADACMVEFCSSQVFVPWQFSQDVEKPAVTWFGLVAVLKSFAWHE